MKDIIIIGTGKAAYTHFRGYKKIKNKGNIFFVDLSNKIKNENIPEQKIYRYIKDVVLQTKLNIDNIIVDICVPKESFYTIIYQCIELGISNIIVEKPFIATKEFFENHSNLNIIMIQNYIYSKITNKVLNYIKTNNLKIESIITNFSKNRILDSLKNRGFEKDVTQIFEIEMPHQIYMTDFLLEEADNIDILYKEKKDFIYDKVVLKNHGYGKIIMNQGNAKIYHESDIMTYNTRKELTVICEDGTIIEAKFLIYDEKFNLLKKGQIKIISKGREICEEIEEDDNMYNCLNEYYTYLNSNKYNSKYKDKILRFSKIFEKI